MSSSSFPLLRLPFVALKQVIEKVEAKERISLSFCSKRMHYAARRFSNKASKVSICLYGRDDICIAIDEKISYVDEKSYDDELSDEEEISGNEEISDEAEISDEEEIKDDDELSNEEEISDEEEINDDDKLSDDNELSDEEEMSVNNETRSSVYIKVKAAPEGGLDGWITIRVEGKIAHFQEYQNCFLTYWDDLINGTKSIIEYITNLFGVQVHLVEIEEDGVWMMDIIEELQGPKTYSASIQGSNDNGLTDEQFRRVLIDLNPTDLQIFQTPSNEFRLESFNKKYDELKIRGNWLTIENLCQLDCIKLEAGQAEFTTLEINRFLKHVLAGGASNRWKYSSMGVQSYNEVEILDGISKLLTAVPGRDSFERDEIGWRYLGNIIRGGELVGVEIDYTICWQTVRLFILDGYC